MALLEKAKLQSLFRYLVLIMAVVAAGTLSGLIVMQVALRGTVDVTTPSIEGDEVVNALEKITKAGLNLKITSLEYDDEKPRNTIISQFPKAGTAIKKGRDVRVVICRGPREFDMPALAGLPLRQATNLLHEKGVSLAAVGKVHSRVEQDKVIAQFPPAGTHVSDLAQVDMVVSLGPPEKALLVPDLAGTPAEQAKKELERAGFIVRNIQYENRPEGAAGAVIAQNPAAGMPVPEGSEISLTALKLSQSPGKPATFALYNFTLPANAGQAAVNVVQESSAGKKDIYSRTHNGGETISLMVEISGPTVVRVYLNDKLAELKQF